MSREQIAEQILLHRFGGQGVGAFVGVRVEAVHGQSLAHVRQQDRFQIEARDARLATLDEAIPDAVRVP